MGIRIALAGNPNCGKTTLFNLLTGTHQYVGNWPGVTVEKKEGKLKKNTEITVTDLPGIYSLSPYTPEEVVARNYLTEEKPEVILNIIDGSHLERNLYLTTQLLELGIPVVAAVNMMDVVRKTGDKIKTEDLSKSLGCPIVEISALKNEGIDKAIEECLKAAEGAKPVPQHTFSGPVEHAIAHIEEAVLHERPEQQQRWYAIKLFERDEKIIEKLGIGDDKLKHIEEDIKKAEKEMDDDAESIITNERYEYIGTLMKKCYRKKDEKALTVSDKIDKVVTNRILALPIFVVVMFLVYSIVMMPVPMPWGNSLGTTLTDWANDGVFGDDGWYLLGIGQDDYDSAMDEYAAKNIWTDDFKKEIKTAADAGVTGAADIYDAIESGSFGDFDEACDKCGKYFSDGEATQEIEKDSWIIPKHIGLRENSTSGDGAIFYFYDELSEADKAVFENMTGVSFTVSCADNDKFDDIFVFDEGGEILKIKKDAVIDYEKLYPDNTCFTVTITAEDGTDSVSLTKVIEITDVNESPEMTNKTFTVSEDIESGGEVGTVMATDPDTAYQGDEGHPLGFDVLKYSIEDNGSTDFPFEINADTGVIKLKKNEKLDYEKKDKYKFNVRVTDSSTDDNNPPSSSEKTITILVLDVNEPSEFVDIDKSYDIWENCEVGTSVGYFFVYDEDNEDVDKLSITITDKNATESRDVANLFEIIQVARTDSDHQTYFRIKTKDSLDYEKLYKEDDKNADFNVTLTITDTAGHKVSKDTIIEVTDENEETCI